MQRRRGQDWPRYLNPISKPTVPLLPVATRKVALVVAWRDFNPANKPERWLLCVGKGHFDFVADEVSLLTQAAALPTVECEFDSVLEVQLRNLPRDTTRELLMYLSTAETLASHRDAQFRIAVSRQTTTQPRPATPPRSYSASATPSVWSPWCCCWSSCFSWLQAFSPPAF